MHELIQVVGGLGMFLLGMSVMTEGLSDLADDRLRGLLSRATRSPTGGAVTGAIATAAVQSSSATTVAAIGFVSAGLLSFPQALGIIFGANIGTTITGWFVALLGFKLKLGSILLPSIAVGVMIRLAGRTSGQRGFGRALAGFGLVFVGLGFLQDGMGSFSEVITPDSFPPDTIVGRLFLMLIGLVLTVVTQSSSAGVAIALTAVNVGSISLAQAAAMVIGMDIGTTVTAIFATIGGTIHARRTGWAHVIYNVMTGACAFLMLTPYLYLLDMVLPNTKQSDPELALVGFHSLFNFLGVVFILPFTSRFASFIIRLVPEAGNPLLSRLDPRLKGTPELALAAADATVGELIGVVFSRLSETLVGGSRSDENETKAQQCDEAIHATQQYISSVALLPDKEALVRRGQASLHILDHLHRLSVRLRERHRIDFIRSMESTRSELKTLAITAKEIANRPLAPDEPSFETYRQNYQQLKRTEKAVRVESISAATHGKCTAKSAIKQANAARGLRRMGYHVWRIVWHLHDACSGSAIAAALPEPANKS